MSKDATARQRTCITCIRFATGMVFDRSAGFEGAGFKPASTGRSLDLFVEFIRPSSTHIKILRYQVPTLHVVADRFPLRL